MDCNDKGGIAETFNDISVDILIMEKMPSWG